MTIIIKHELSDNQLKIMSQALTDLTSAIQAETDAITALTSAVATIPVTGLVGTPDSALVPLTTQATTNASNITEAIAAIQKAVTPPVVPSTP